MRKMMAYLLALLLSGAVTSCGFFADQETPEGYVRHCARILDTGLYADSPQWKAKKQEMLAAGEVFCDDPIDPDVSTETPLEDALAWIRSRSH